MKAFIGKSLFYENHEKESKKSQHSLLSHLFLSNSRELKETQLKLRELKGTQGN